MDLNIIESDAVSKRMVGKIAAVAMSHLIWIRQVPLIERRWESKQVEHQFSIGERFTRVYLCNSSPYSEIQKELS